MGFQWMVRWWVPGKNPKTHIQMVMKKRLELGANQRLTRS
jgi:hypothetical protein